MFGKNHRNAYDDSRRSLGNVQHVLWMFAGKFRGNLQEYSKKILEKCHGEIQEIYAKSPGNALGPVREFRKMSWKLPFVGAAR